MPFVLLPDLEEETVIVVAARGIRDGSYFGERCEGKRVKLFAEASRDALFGTESPKSGDAFGQEGMLRRMGVLATGDVAAAETVLDTAYVSVIDYGRHLEVIFGEC